MTIKPFFPRFDAKFTMTPNAFFDQVVTEADSLNEVRAIGYVIRKTIGWNKKFECITRKQFVTEAKISNGQLTKTLQSCIDKGWLIVFRTGYQGKEENFYFLNDTLNAQLLLGLEQNLYTISDLQYKSEEGLIQLLNSYGIEYNPNACEIDDEEANEENNLRENPPVPDEVGPQEEGYGFRRGTETVEVRKPYGYGNRRGTESVEVGVRNPYGEGYGIRRGRGTESVPVSDLQTHTEQGLPDSLNTTSKYNILNTKDQIQQHRSVTVDQIGQSEKIKERPSDDVVVSKPLLQSQSSKFPQEDSALLTAIFETAEKLGLPVDEYLAKELVSVGNKDQKRILLGMEAAKQFASNKKIDNWYGLIINAVRHKRQPSPESLTADDLIYKAKQEKYKDVYMN